MTDYGAQSASWAVGIQIFCTILATLAFVPWLLSDIPAGPAIRAMKECIYFATLLSDSNLADNLKGQSNSATHQLWQSLDIIVRIGESIMTQDEEIGHITMDKAKVVRPMSNGRRYA